MSRSRLDIRLAGLVFLKLFGRLAVMLKLNTEIRKCFREKTEK